MEQFEKVIKGLESIIANDYPWGKNDYVLVCETALALIRQQQERIEELEEAQRMMARLITEEDFKKADANGNIPAWIEYTPEWKNADHVWALIDRNIFNFKYKRAWTQRPTDEQRKEAKWDE